MDMDIVGVVVLGMEVGIEVMWDVVVGEKS